MVKGSLSTKLAVLLLVLSMGGPCQARTVKSLEIEATGQTDKSLESEYALKACKKFRPTKIELVRFFNKAYPVEAYIATNDRYSPCYAKGSLRFSDGSFGEWILYSSGVAMFTFNRGDVVHLFYRKYGWYDPNGCTYGVSSRGEC